QQGTQLNLSINIKLNQQQLQRVNRALQSTLQQQMFWVSSNKPLDWAWVKGLPSAVMAQFEAASINLHTEEWKDKTLPLLILIVPMLILGVALRWKRQTLRDKVKALSKDIGKLSRDTHLHTPKALIFTGLEVLPGALLIMAMGLLFLFSGLSEPKVIWFLALRLTAAYMAFAMLLKILRPGGMAESHFNQSPTETARKYRALKYVWRSLIPLIIVATLGELDPSRLADDAIGQVVTLTMLAITLFLVYPLFRSRSHKGEQNDLLQWFSAVALTLAPIALIVLTVLGYYYTALKLTNRFIDTFYLFMAWSIIQQTATRGLAVAARRLAHRRAVARREQLKQQEDIDATELIEDKPMALDEINEQSLRLTKMVLFVLLAGSFYWLWSDLVAVLSYLDSITLWHTTAGAAGSEVLQPVSLRDFLLAITFAAVAWLLTKNLPGLLEVLVLSRLQLSQGTSYTITTMLSYAITSLGVLLSLSTLGMTWDKLQWLVAALSLGIGFGLQEIFANFVSGLIILFERPVRIGDVITLGNFSGSVSKIRIRATTVTDFDRKEIIVPNKMFITTQLTNWSLSDTTTRIILRIGVAYGSDLDKTKELLLQAAYENHRVLKDPEPVVYFLNFGASTLDHEIRLYVKELGDRNPAIDEINRRIDKLFREHGIEIAFNQVDVYVKNMANGDELKLPVNPAVIAGAAGAGAVGTPLPPPVV
ncbi:MAG: mechanosensitive channel MscK, partial [Aeromonadaceae bacterium]